jgi:hypothetical protein
MTRSGSSAEAIRGGQGFWRFEVKSPENVMRARVEGYAGRLSYGQGDTITIHASARAGDTECDVTIVRVGRQREVVWSQQNVPVSEQLTPVDAASNGCDWPATLSVEVEEWRPGYYEVHFDTSSPEPLASPAFFVVRAAPGPQRPKAVLVLTTNTYNAYNDWGGDNLYTGGTAVSFRRPMAIGLLHRPPGEILRAATPQGMYDPDMDWQRAYVRDNQISGWSAAAGWFNWEAPFVRWAEENGFDLDYAVNADLADVPDLLDDRNLVISVGHDEYWSWPMRDAVENFVAAGGNVAFFSGNVACWQVRIDEAGTTMTSYKYDARDRDPVAREEDRHLMTGAWSDPIIGRPENRLTGVSFARGGYSRLGHGAPRGSGAFTVWRPDHWLFEGTDLRYGDLLGGSSVVVGYESDGCELTIGEDGLPAPTGRDGTPSTFVILGSSPVHLWSNTPTSTDFPGASALEPDELGDLEYFAEWLYGTTESADARRIGHGNAVLGISEAEGTIFTTGSTDWAYGLRYRDPMIERITLNVLSRLSVRRTPPD